VYALSIIYPYVFVCARVKTCYCGTLRVYERTGVRIARDRERAHCVHLLFPSSLSRVSFFLGLNHLPCRARGNASGDARVINPRATSTRESPEPPGNPVTAIDRSIDRSVSAIEGDLSQKRSRSDPFSNVSRKFSRAVRPRVGAHLRVHVCNPHTYTRPSCNGALGRSLNVDTSIEFALTRYHQFRCRRFSRARARACFAAENHAGNLSSSPLQPLDPSSRSLLLPFLPSATFRFPNKSLNESPLTLNYYYLSLYRLTLYPIVSLQKYIYHYLQHFGYWKPIVK